MDRTIVKNFAVFGRKNLLEGITKSAEKLGILSDGIYEPTEELTQNEIEIKNSLTTAIAEKSINTDYYAGYYFVLEDVAYSWFSRLVAIRYMVVNNYIESDVFSETENFKERFVLLCKELDGKYPNFFVPLHDYSEYLLQISTKEKSSLVYKLLNSIDDNDFAEGVEILGWFHQYYNTDVFNLLYDGDMSKKKILADYIPAATQLYTPDWVVKYMVENSLGRHWIDHLYGCGKNETADMLKSAWLYYIDDDESAELNSIRENKKDINPEDITFIDPCMGSGHILVYAFDILMQIYKSCGYDEKQAVRSILKNNLFGIDIDSRAYHLSHFAVMMKARQYDNTIMSDNVDTNLCAIEESNSIQNVVEIISVLAGEDTLIKEELEYLVTVFYDAKEYGSIINVRRLDYSKIEKRIADVLEQNLQYSDEIREKILPLIKQGRILSKHYNAVATNPPYLNSSRMSKKLLDYVSREYSIAKSDMATVFIQKVAGVLCDDDGIISMITTVSWMYIKSFERLRKYLLQTFQLNSLVDFGTELFEGKIGHLPVVSWVNRKHLPFQKTKAVRLAEYNYSRRNEKQSQFFNKENHYISDQLDYAKIPAEPVAYWLSSELISAFEKGRTLGDVTIARNGMKTGDNKRFLRLWWEVPKSSMCLDANSAEEARKSGARFFPYNKGGEYRKWYGNNDYLVDWQDNGAVVMGEAKADGRHTQDYPDELKFLPLVTWSLITVKPAFRFKTGAISDIAGMSYYSTEEKLLYYLGYSNTVIATEIIRLLAPTMNCQVGDVARLPVLSSKEYEPVVADIVRENIAISKADWDSFETSWDFDKHPFILYKNYDGDCRISDAYYRWENDCKDRFAKLKENEEELNRIFFEIYGIRNEFKEEIDDKDITIRPADKQRDIKSFISYAVGCIMGRYSLDNDGVVCSGDDFDIRNYRTFIPVKENYAIFSEEPVCGDIASLFIDFVSIVFGDKYLNENLEFIATSLGTKGKSAEEIIRKYFYTLFYKEHCQMYSVGVSGKRPVYWMFDSGAKGGFKALVYSHRWQKDTINTIRTKALPKVMDYYKNQIENLVAEQDEDLRNNNSIIEKYKQKLKETESFDDKLLLIGGNEISATDGIRYNHQKVQTYIDGKKIKILTSI